MYIRKKKTKRKKEIRRTKKRKEKQKNKTIRKTEYIHQGEGKTIFQKSTQHKKIKKIQNVCGVQTLPMCVKNCWIAKCRWMCPTKMQISVWSVIACVLIVSSLFFSLLLRVVFVFICAIIVFRFSVFGIDRRPCLS